MIAAWMAYALALVLPSSLAPTATGGSGLSLGTVIPPSLAAILVGLVIQRRLARCALLCPRDQVEGTEVRRTRHLGPAVVGLVPGVILFPEWARALDPEDQRLSLIHEEEHLHARDHLLLFGSYVLVALVPWNLALWWQLRRLKDAVEKDCDGRVLARGGNPEGYAALLLGLASTRRRTVPFALGLRRTGSRVGRRIVEMADGLVGVRPIRAVIHGGLVVAFLALGLQVPPPSAAGRSSPPPSPLPSSVSNPAAMASVGGAEGLPPGPVTLEGDDARRLLAVVRQAVSRSEAGPDPLELSLEGGASFRIETRDRPPGATLTLSRPDPSLGPGKYRRVSLGVDIVAGEPS